MAETRCRQCGTPGGEHKMDCTAERWPADEVLVEMRTVGNRPDRVQPMTLDEICAEVEKTCGWRPDRPAVRRRLREIDPTIR